MPLAEELQRGDGRHLRAFFMNFAPPGRTFEQWLQALQPALRAHDTLQGFACEFSLLATGSAPTGPATGASP